MAIEDDILRDLERARAEIYRRAGVYGVCATTDDWIISCDISSTASTTVVVDMRTCPICARDLQRWGSRWRCVKCRRFFTERALVQGQGAPDLTEAQKRHLRGKK